MTQREKIERHLNDYGNITSWEAFTNYGITRLSAIIYILKHHKGYKFNDEWVNKKNRYDERVHFKRYRIVREVNK